MESMPKLDRTAFILRMHQEADALLGQVADAINNAPDGHVIAGSECQVRDLFSVFRKQAYELGLQMRTDAAEAAFPPSEALPDRQEPSQ
jgi:hypothetical protein